MLIRPINLAIVDDHALFRKTLKNFLSEQQNLRVCIQASSMPELFDKLEEYPVDILLMDVFMPGMNGDEALLKMRAEFPDIRVLVLSMSTDLNLIGDLLDNGIHG